MLYNVHKSVAGKDLQNGGYISFQYRSESEKIWENSSSLRNLGILYNLKASYEEDIEKILKFMPNLVELGAVFFTVPIKKTVISFQN